LALAAGFFVPCAAPPSVQAGDKIEFSTPSASLEVPKVAPEEKESEKYSAEAPLRPDTSGVDVLPPTQVFVITNPNRKSGRTRDPASMDNRDDTADADSSDDSSNAKLRPNKNAPKLWDLGVGWDQDSRNTFSQRREDNPAGRESLRNRLELSRERGSDYRRDERFSRDSSDSTEETTWSRSFFHHGPASSGGTREGQFESFYDGVRAASQVPIEAYSMALPPNPIDTMVRESQLPPGMAQYNLQLDALHGKIPDETQNPRFAFQPVQTRPLSLNPDPYARLAPPPAPPGQVQSPPAILPFPKRPGSVFQ
jgi:hypothetical protein